MAKSKVLLIGEIEHPAARKEWEELADYAELMVCKTTDRASFIEDCKSGALDGVVAIFRTFNSVELTGRFDDELVGFLPKSLKFICHNGAGYDQVEIPPCTARGISVSNVPHAPSNTTADTAVFLIIGCLRNFNPTLKSIRNGFWRGNPLPVLGHDPRGKTLGIIGMGSIGRNLARKMVGFGMRIVYCGRKRLERDVELKECAGAEWMEFEDLLKASDVVSLNLPLNSTTRHLISAPQIAMMKAGAVLINTARGAIVDEDALVQALESGHLASAGLDVFEHEPHIHPGLLKNERVLLLPHMGTWTEETQEGMEKWCLSNVRDAVTVGRLRSRVREQEGLSYSGVSLEPLVVVNGELAAAAAAVTGEGQAAAAAAAAELTTEEEGEGDCSIEKHDSAVEMEEDDCSKHQQKQDFLSANEFPTLTTITTTTATAANA